MKRLALALALAGCGGRPSEGDCQRLLDHFLTVEGQAAIAGKFVDVTAPMRAALADQQRQFRGQLGSDFVAKCREELSVREVGCALGANDQAAMDRCEGR